MTYPTLTITVGRLRLTALAAGGPRILGLQLDHGPNLLAETPNARWETPWGEFALIGGHRLWHAPEAFPRSYWPDLTGPTAEPIANGLVLRSATDPGGIAKTITVTIEPDKPRVHLRHALTNQGLWPVELAPWAITQLAPGGLAILPLHDDCPPVNPLTPNRQIAFWPYTPLPDPRLHLTGDCILIDTAQSGPPAKVGARSPAGWLAYLRDDVLFVKRVAFIAGGCYPDHNCNLEIYYDQGCTELETLAPLGRLAPGDTVTHDETWYLVPWSAVIDQRDLFKTLAKVVAELV
ncbi:hypothetical protein [Chloroflexus sp.]|uniref:hypothetical protein n=1 Tax=Chloroflexus sp. TaxID=1904827 RepID=UPI002628D614|nr:hypothetical protein [uncultured Chloroflexus sp.]